MTNSAEKALLPAGLQDLLPPDAAHEAATLERLVAAFASFGYERVKAPLMEFEDTLLSGAGKAVANESFRLMDPVSQRMMALRADITPQVARIAATRLQSQPRPLRLCYGGQVLRVRGGQLRPERQFAQAGVELIGAPQQAGDAEVVVLALFALDATGVRELTVDLSMPTLVPAVIDGLAIEQAAGEALRRALDRKDAEAVSSLSGDRSDLFDGLLRASGPADQALSALRALGLPLIGTLHGKLVTQGFAGLFSRALLQASLKHLRRVWLIAPVPTNAEIINMLQPYLTKHNRENLEK